MSDCFNISRMSAALFSQRCEKTSLGFLDFCIRWRATLEWAWRGTRSPARRSRCIVLDIDIDIDSIAQHNHVGL